MGEVKDNLTEYHSTKVQAIISKMPGWILRWGTLTVLFALVVISVCGYVIKYPETINLPLNIQEKKRLAPSDSKKHYLVASGKVLQGNFLRVKAGQEVRIEFLSYPKNKYGFLIGIVASVADTLSRDSTFHLTINLPETLVTNKRHLIIYKGGMIAKGTLVIRKSSLLERLLKVYP
jgi:hypothetical protein